MKKKFNSTNAILLATILFSIWGFTAAAAATEVRRITVKGNTIVTLIQGNSFWVTVDNEEEQKKVSIHQIGDELVISSTEVTPVEVKVHIKQLFRIVALDSSKVKTLGKLDQKYLQLLLSDDALVRVRTNTEALYTEIRGHARLELLGSTNRHILKRNATAKLKMDNFSVLVTELVPSKDSAIVVNR